MVRNYQKELEKIIECNQREGKIPTLLLHGCCAPCSSYCLEYLSRFFSITLCFYNPNIYPESEYNHRAAEVMRLVSEMDFVHPVRVVVESFEPGEFYDAVKGYEKEKEGGERCFLCYELRLRRAAQRAKEGGYDYFTTTLSISPLKNASKLNEIGERIAAEYGVSHLPSDFKKKEGYKRSIELSRKHNLYRQNYCGCVFSRKENSMNNENE